MYAYTIADSANKRDPEFPFAPELWQQSEAREIAKQEGLKFGDDQRLVLRSLQEYFHKHQDSAWNYRELKDALDESFHDKGGIAYLYQLFPGGPIVQGCKLAGLEIPAGAVDKSFGSVL